MAELGDPPAPAQNGAVREVELAGPDLAAWVGAEVAGPDAILGHVVATGHGRCWADRWPGPSVLLAETAGNYLLRGVPQALDPATLRPLVRGFLDAPPAFDDLLDTAFPGHARWDRIVYRLDGAPTSPALLRDPSVAVRMLESGDTPAVEALDQDVGWVTRTWDGPAGLAASGHAVGAFVEGRVAAVACTFFLGVRHDEIGVATEPGFRGRGLATRCAALLAARSVAAGRVPSWTTSVDNHASRRVAERLGFDLVREDVLHVIGVDVP